MRIDFNALEETVCNNRYGGEKALASRSFSDGRNKIIYGTLEKVL